MGYNTTVLVLNDALHDIRDDKDFGRKLYEAISRMWIGPEHRYEDVRACNYLNAATVIEHHHASGIAIVAIGGNCGTVIGHVTGTHHKEEDKLKIIRELADQLGYTLRKKS